MVVVKMTMATRKLTAAGTIMLVMLTLARTNTIIATMAVVIASMLVATVETTVPSTMGVGALVISSRSSLIRLAVLMTMVDGDPDLGQHV